ncbi:hypothetical protein CEE37_08555 [candidate division LCP-89 bacterium B3_LCP]|uniref:Peptidase C14 caspase domain-containing protein n=1 Tax=candidate division LCP-89 bacterium B3_LCP TaxID=2012998 RepID=A0A532UZM5_UNCL8|nr:MAG: hypothetical protein CEE37_08555 [candidate division LCP-89 bacterium B3_LCP]
MRMYIVFIPLLFSLALTNQASEDGIREMSFLMERQVSFEITDVTIKKLNANGIPDSILQELGQLKSRTFDKENLFIDQIRRAIGDEPTDQYKSWILKHAKITDELDVEIVYRDPSDVDIRLKDSRIIPFYLTIENRSERQIKFNRQDIQLNVGLSSPLRTVKVETVLEAIEDTATMRPFLNKVLKFITSQSKAFHRTYHKDLEGTLKEYSFQDSIIKPHKKCEGLVFFMLPEDTDEVLWSTLRVLDFPSQAITTRGYHVYTNEKQQEKHRNIFEKIWKILFKAPPPIENSYALLAFTGDYEYYKDLDYAGSDIERLGEFLSKKQGYKRVVVITDSNLTIPKLKYPQEHFMSKITPKDRFLFYYAGHGDTKLINGVAKGYLPLADAKPGGDDNCIPMDSLVMWMNQLQSKHLLVILDCCFSGLALRGLDIESVDPKYLLMAGTERESALEGERWDGSLFTHLLMEGLRGKADVYKDDVITIWELYGWLRSAVKKEAIEAGYELIPQMKDFTKYSSKEEFFFIHTK